ncbi:MAG: putative peptide transport system permease protein [Frankiales bacterium]|nr:putative peptide transport system permease protein [Frankiales bacterium]
MTRFLVRRLALGLLVVWLVASAVFVLFYVSPGEPARTLCGPKCTPTQIEQTKARLSLGDPVGTQYVHFLGRLAHLDFGTSARFDQPVADRLGNSLAPTLSLVVGAALLWLVVGVAAGIVAARRPGSIRDRVITLGALSSLSVPTFVVGMGLIYLCYSLPRKLGYYGMPAGGYVPLTGPKGSVSEWFVHLVLPWCSLAIVSAGIYARLTRTAMLTALGEDFVRTARAKGVSERRIVLRHALPSAAPGLLSVFGVDVGTLLGGAVVIEPLFNLHGLGQEALDAFSNADLPIIVGLVLLGTVAVVVASLVVDVLHAVLDPRVTLH